MAYSLDGISRLGFFKLVTGRDILTISYSRYYPFFFFKQYLDSLAYSSILRDHILIPTIMKFLHLFQIIFNISRDEKRFSKENRTKRLCCKIRSRRERERERKVSRGCKSSQPRISCGTGAEGWSASNE